MATRFLPMVALTTCLSVCLPLSQAELPGFQIRVSNKGLRYANSVAQWALTRELKGLHIPNQQGRSSGLDWKIHGIENRGVTLPKSTLNFDPSRNGLSWSISNLGLELHSSYWRIKYKKGWFKLSTSGSLDLEVKRVSLKVTASLGQTGGRLQMKVSRCEASVGDVDVYLYGGTAFILNLFRGIIGDEVKDILESQMCKVARKLINEELNHEFANLKDNVRIDGGFLLDYSLVSPPKVKATGLEMYSKGEVFWETEVQESPFSPQPIAPLADESHMMYLWVTDYLANTAVLNAHKHGALTYKVTPNDFPPNDRAILNTTCELFCVGSFLPMIESAYPNSYVQARVASLHPPTLSISPEGIRLDGQAKIGLDVITPDGQIHDVIDFEAEVFLSVRGSVVSERLSGQITDHRVAINKIISSVGDINPDALRLILKAALKLGLVLGLNSVLEKGVDLPVTQVISFKDAHLTLLNGSILIAADITALQPDQEQPKTTKQPQLTTTEKLILLQQKITEESQQPSTTTEKVEMTVTDQPQWDKSNQTDTNTTARAHYWDQQPEQPSLPPRMEWNSNSTHSHRQPSKEFEPLDQATFCDRLIDFCHTNVNFCSGGE